MPKMHKQDIWPKKEAIVVIPLVYFVGGTNRPIEAFLAFIDIFTERL